MIVLINFSKHYSRLSRETCSPLNFGIANMLFCLEHLSFDNNWRDNFFKNMLSAKGFPEHLCHSKD